MQISMKKTIIILLLIFLFLPLSVFGGGVVFNEEEGVYRLDAPSNFSSHINYKDGEQGMVVSFETENVDNNLIWIFPILALPEEVEIGISLGNVRFSGNNLFMEVGNELENMEKMFFYSQIWPYFYERLFHKELKEVYIETTPLRDASVEVQELVKIYKHLKEEGMGVYLISAKEEELQGLLEDKNIKIKEDFFSLFENYINRDYSFVVSFMEAPEKEEMEGEGEILKSIKRGIMVNFPTKEVFYPLSSMQIYGEERIRINLDVTGYVSPKLFSEIEEDTNINYYLERRISMEESHKDFLGQPEHIESFTKIRINTASKNLIDDLTIKEHTPFVALLSYSFYKNPFGYFVLLLVFFSFVAGMITGPVVSRKDRNIKGMLKWGKIGLFNCLSVVGFAVRVGFEKMEKGKIQKPLLIMLYTIVFVLLTFFVIGQFFE